MCGLSAPRLDLPRHSDRYLGCVTPLTSGDWCLDELLFQYIPPVLTEPFQQTMNQLCKVCDEPAAGFHFGAFTCEGCKSFFGRSYNNISSITPCKNSGRCVINKKNRTSCKACRLKKCITVGMSKGGSRYGRRSNWFKIHCLLEQEQNEARRMSMNMAPATPPPRPNTWPMEFLGPPSYDSRMQYLQHHKSPKEEIGYEEYKNASSPTISSPDSHNSDSSIEIGERIKPHLSFYKQESPRDFTNPYLPFGTLASLQTILHNPSFLPPLFPPSPHLLFSPNLVSPKPLSPPVRQDTQHKRLHLDTILRSQESPVATPVSEQSDSAPMDLSVRPISRVEDSCHSDEDDEEHITVDEEDLLEDPHQTKATSPLDLTTKVQ